MRFRSFVPRGCPVPLSMCPCICPWSLMLPCVRWLAAVPVTPGGARSLSPVPHLPSESYCRAAAAEPRVVQPHLRCAGVALGWGTSGPRTGQEGRAPGSSPALSLAWCVHGKGRLEGKHGLVGG